MCSYKPVTALFACNTDMSVPSLVNICLDFLAENAGYIVDLDGVPSSAVLQICARSTGFGLVNLEVVLSDSISRGDLSTSSLWLQMIQKVSSDDPGFLIRSPPISPGEDYARQLYTASLLRKQASTPFLDPDDFQLLIESAGRFLSFCEMHSNPSAWLQPCFAHLTKIRFLNISQAQIGPDGSVSLKSYMLESPWLQWIDVSRNRLGIVGANHVAEGIEGSRALAGASLAFNGFGLQGVKRVLGAVMNSRGVAEVDLSRNLFGKDVAEGFKYRKALQLPRHININIS